MLLSDIASGAMELHRRLLLSDNLSTRLALLRLTCSLRADGEAIMVP